MLVDIADILANAAAVSTEEIELWVKHLRPVWKASPEWTRNAVLNWHNEMKDLGLLAPGAGDMEAFLSRE
jgi:hypothetical protein